MSNKIEDIQVETLNWSDISITFVSEKNGKMSMVFHKGMTVKQLIKLLLSTAYHFLANWSD